MLTFQPGPGREPETGLAHTEQMNTLTPFHVLGDL